MRKKEVQGSHRDRERKAIKEKRMIRWTGWSPCKIIRVVVN